MPGFQGTPISFPGLVQPPLDPALSLMEIGGLHGKPYREYAGDCKDPLAERARPDVRYRDKKDTDRIPSRGRLLPLHYGSGATHHPWTQTAYSLHIGMQTVLPGPTTKPVSSPRTRIPIRNRIYLPDSLVLRPDPSSTRERRTARARIARYYGIDPEQSRETVCVPSWAHLPVPRADDVHATPRRNSYPSQAIATSSFLCGSRLVRTGLARGASSAGPTAAWCAASSLPPPIVYAMLGDHIRSDENAVARAAVFITMSLSGTQWAPSSRAFGSGLSRSRCCAQRGCGRAGLFLRLGTTQ
ncbi:hypothetical protein BU15DRAFT_81121 [Melanogaster broomeanus]|nr:hypothetical protein BU15DRAFT_81121 [Melanogaster broomeanus]